MWAARTTASRYSVPPEQQVTNWQLWTPTCLDTNRRFQMRSRSFIIAYALVVAAILLFADRRPPSRPQGHYSQVVDLTDTAQVKRGSEARSGTRIISPAALMPGTWGTAQIPAERLIAPLVVMDLDESAAQISVDDVVRWETQHGDVPQGAIVAVRRVGSA